MTKKKLYRSLIIVVLNLLFLDIYAQKTITIGNGGNGWGHGDSGDKYQMLVLASELKAAGMTSGNITNLSFDIAIFAGTILNEFTVKMKLTTTSVLTDFFSNTGFTTVWGPLSYAGPTNGWGDWTTHDLSTPFYWDGTSNLLIETCFIIPNSGWISINYTPTSFNSTTHVSSACSIMTGYAGINRPNIRVTYNANLPKTDFTAEKIYPCDGLVQFTDLSCCGVTSWFWNFGDGQTSTAQNPLHNYISNGTYPVKLITSNPNGSDTLIKNNYIAIAIGSAHVETSCSSSTTNYCCRFGIANVTFNTIDNNSGNASEGYKDFTCSQATDVYSGVTYNISVSTPQPAKHNVRVWIDYNNNGLFDSVTELAFSANSTYVATGTIIIPGNAVVNKPLRMRVSADSEFSPIPTPCGKLDRGQAEDYSVKILKNIKPPLTNFSTTATTSCDGNIGFKDLSTNVPSSWYWSFGDGTTSMIQNPVHTYDTSGTYTVKLVTTNAYGADSLIKTNYIHVLLSSQPVAASCIPATFSYCCGYGIYNFRFNTINNSSGDGAEGYKDYTCEQRTSVTEGSSYLVSVQTSPLYPQDTKIWIDYNNDSTFNSLNELVYSVANTKNPSGTIIIPQGAVKDKPLRMRIISDYAGSNLSPCSFPVYGQVEDYTVIITDKTYSPIADFLVKDTLFCDGTIDFKDLSMNAPTSWMWYFGDGTTSVTQNPTHTYKSDKIYTIKLVVVNATGTDSLIKTNYVSVIIDNPLCGTVANIPLSRGSTQTSCNGTIYDSGGELSNYIDGSGGWVFIEPPNAINIQLNFEYFSYIYPDVLMIYDGSLSSPLIGIYTGNTLPEGGIIISSGSMITLLESTDFQSSTTEKGFKAKWSCTPNAIEDINRNDPKLFVYPNPSRDIFNISFVATKKEDITITVLNVISTEIYTEHILYTEHYEKSIDLSGFPKGMYLLKIVAGNNVLVRKLSLQ